MANSRIDYPDLSKPLSKGSIAFDEYPDLSKPINQNEFDPSFAEKLAPNIIAGAAEAGHGILNTPYNIGKYLEEKSKNQPTLAKKLGWSSENIPHLPEYNYPEMLGLPKNSTLADKLIRGIVEFAPAMALPEAELGKAGQALTKIPMVGNYLNKAARIGVPQAGYGATQDKNPVEGAATGLATGLVAPAIESGINALRPSRMFRGTLSPEELKSNLSSTEGTNTGLGQVIASPTLNRLQENILPYVFGSGAESTMQESAKQVAEKGTNLLDKIKGENDIENFGETLKSSLKEASKIATQEKNEGFKQLNELADKSGLKIGRSNFQKTASDVLSTINESPELKSEFSPELYKKIENYAKNPEGNTLKLTNIFKGKIGDIANDMYQEGKMHEYGIFKALKESLGKDVDEGFEKSDNPLIKEMYEKNQKDYAEKYALFDDPDIVKFTRRGGDPDILLNHFLRGGTSDRAYLLSKLVEQLGRQKNPSAQDIPLIAHFSKSVDENGKVDPVKLASLYNKLGKNQKNVLIRDKDVREELEKFSNLTSKNKEAIYLMHNPKTGARNTELLSKLTQIIFGATAGGVPGLLGVTGGSAIVGRLLNKALTSPKYREKLVNKMIENKESKLPGRTAGTGMLNMLLNQGGE